MSGPNGPEGLRAGWWRNLGHRAPITCDTPATHLRRQRTKTGGFCFTSSKQSRKTIHPGVKKSRKQRYSLLVSEILRAVSPAEWSRRGAEEDPRRIRAALTGEINKRDPFLSLETHPPPWSSFPTHPSASSRTIRPAYLAFSDKNTLRKRAAASSPAQSRSSLSSHAASGGFFLFFSRFSTRIPPVSPAHKPRRDWLAARTCKNAPLRPALARSDWLVIAEPTDFLLKHQASRKRRDRGEPGRTHGTILASFCLTCSALWMRPGLPIGTPKLRKACGDRGDPDYRPNRSPQETDPPPSECGYACGM
ncbi:hypothetical protein SRHO_G00266910 [Serrasalmus rhombeus]